MEGGVSGTLNIVEMMCDNEKVSFFYCSNRIYFYFFLVQSGQLVWLSGPDRPVIWFNPVIFISESRTNLSGPVESVWISGPAQRRTRSGHP